MSPLLEGGSEVDIRRAIYKFLAEIFMRYSSSSQDATRGRVVLVIIFLLFCGLDATVYLTTPEEGLREVLSSTIIRQLWTVFLLGAMWFRHNWARYVLIGVLLVGAIFYIPLVMELMDLGIGIPPFLIVWMLVNLAVMVALIYLPAIRNLTYRRR